jgi:hypothetical protein
VTNKNCSNCAAYNTTWTMTYWPDQSGPDGCVWDTGDLSPCFDGGEAVHTADLTCSFDGTEWTLKLVIWGNVALSGLHAAIYTGPLVDCNGGNTLTKTAFNGSPCDTFPGTLTVFPG